MENNLRRRFPLNLVWRYFTPEDMPNARCNICQSRICGSGGYMQNIERHLVMQHPEVIEEVREEIRYTWLMRHFVFDEVQIWRVKCITCAKCYSIFKGINYLADHLRGHRIHRYLWVRQHPVAEGAHGEPADEHPQLADQDG